MVVNFLMHTSVTRITSKKCMNGGDTCKLLRYILIHLHIIHLKNPSISEKYSLTRGNLIKLLFRYLTAHEKSHQFDHSIQLSFMSQNFFGFLFFHYFEHNSEEKKVGITFQGVVITLLLYSFIYGCRINEIFDLTNTFCGLSLMKAEDFCVVLRLTLFETA